MTREEQIEALADRIVDSLDIEALCEIALCYLRSEYEKMTDEQLRLEIKEWAKDLLED